MMDRVAVEEFLSSEDFGTDSYLLASSSSSGSDSECCCSDDLSDSSTEKVKLKRAKVEGYAEITVPGLINSDFKHNFRVSRSTCIKISELIYSDFCSGHKGGWEKITPTKASLVLLWYLGNHETFRQISTRFKITQSCIHNIVKVGSRNLSSKLHQYVRRLPAEKCEAKSDAFFDMCKLHGVIGAIGVSHMKILKPREEPEKFTNRKNYCSIAVQGIVTSNKKFIDFFVSEGALEPSEILEKSSFSSRADDLCGNYFLIGNSSYPCKSWLISPFPDYGNLSSTQKHFNDYLRNACSILDDVFGHLKGRFRRLDHLENKDLPVIYQCVTSACIIHNICVDNDDDGDFFVEEEVVTGKFDAEDDDNGRRVEVFKLFLANVKKELCNFS